MQSVFITTRYRGGGWTARAGRGKAATSASCTSSADRAAQRAAGKFFRIDPCNVVKVEDIKVTEVKAKNASSTYSEQQWRADLPDAPAR